VGAALCAALSVSAGIVAFADRAESKTQTIDVLMRYSRFHASHFSFPAGTTVTFVIRNGDPITHEFILGSRRLQHRIETTAHPEHDGSVPGQITVYPGTTRTTTYTFGKVGTVLLGCHEPGHYAYGMRGVVEVTE
jgi:uncharacterized cupredoxin-like copper-binding protein